MASLPPDVRATCSAAIVSMRSAPQHLAQTADSIRTCLASRDLPVALRTFMLQALVLNEKALSDNRAALDAQLAVIDLEPAPRDDQLFSLAALYESTHQYKEGLAALDRIRAAHEASHDLDSTFGLPYYLERGKLLAATGNHYEAIDTLSKVIQAAPAFAEAYRVRGAEREIVGDKAGARTDFIEFARWAPESSIDAATQAKLSGLGINAASERRHPFGNANPLLSFAEQSLGNAKKSLQAATTPQEKAKAYGDISAYLDNSGRSEEALTAIDEAIALAPDDIGLRQSKVTTLVAMNRLDEALTVAAPLLAQMNTELSGAKDPAVVYRKYIEVTASSAWAFILKGNWSSSIDMLADCARGSDAMDKDYLAALYLVIRARGADAAPENAFFEDYIRRSEAMPVTNYRQALLRYMRGRVSLNVVYAFVDILSYPPSLQNALAETWMMAAAYERFFKHDDAAARTFKARIEDLKPYGTNEWMMVRYGGV